MVEWLGGMALKEVIVLLLEVGEVYFVFEVVGVSGEVVGWIGGQKC